MSSFLFKNLKKNGFTITELLVAIFVLAIGILAVLQAVPFAAQIQKSSQMATVAVQLCQGKMEEIISLSYDEIISGNTDEAYGFDSEFPSFRRRTEISYFDPNNPTVVPGGDLGIKKINVIVYWKSPMQIQEKQVKIATLFAER